MSDTTTQPEAEDQEFIGYGPVVDYLASIGTKVQRGTMSFYMNKGYGPTPKERRVVGQYVKFVFTKSELDRWAANRPGRGARTDRMHAGLGRACPICKTLCTVSTE